MDISGSMKTLLVENKKIWYFDEGEGKT